jgi:hypothetical protein
MRSPFNVIVRSRQAILVDGLVRTETPGPGSFVWQPTRIGPAFQWLDHERIRVVEGRLAGRSLRLHTEVGTTTASGRLHSGEIEVGSIALEREPPGKGIVLWDLGVREELRGSGLASILTWVMLRELLAAQSSATFRIRMVRSLRAGGGEGSSVQNIGMCVIANRLGFVPDMDLEEVLRPSNVLKINILPGREENPPGLEIVLRTDPLVLICLMLDPGTGRPVRNTSGYLQLLRKEGVTPELVRRGVITVTNGNFRLPAESIGRFVNRLAVDAAEAVRFFGMIHGL